MKLLLRITVLALAGFGANELYRKLAPRVTGAGDRVSTAVDTTLRPAVAEAAKSVQASAEFASQKIGQASRDLADAALDPNAPTTPAAPAPAHVGDTTTSHPVSEMAAHELGLDSDSAASRPAASAAASKTK